MGTQFTKWGNSFIRTGSGSYFKFGSEDNPLTIGLVSYWKLDDAQDTSMLDSYSIFDGSNVDVSQADSNAKIGTSYQYGFPVTTTETTIGVNASLNTSKFSISFWYNYNGLGNGCAMSNYTSTAGWDLIMSNLAYLTFRTTSNAGSLSDVATGVSNNTWGHMVCTYDEEYVKLYVNGVLKDSSTRSIVSDFTNTVFIIGNRNSDKSYFNGKLDEIGYWSRALTATEVSTLYNNDIGKTYPFS